MILGCGRSGTSIFGELFEGLDGYTYFSEPDFDEILDRYGSGIAVKVPTESKTYICDPGLSISLQELLRVAPDVQIFWIVRHPLDAVCSLRVGISQNWGHHPRPTDWRNWLDKSLIERCAYHWAYINHLGFDSVRDVATLVKFEEMIARPNDFAEFVMEIIGVSIDKASEHLRGWSTRVQNTNNSLFDEAKTSRNYSRPDHSVRVGRWRENLTNAEAKSVSQIVANANRGFEYELVGVR